MIKKIIPQVPLGYVFIAELKHAWPVLKEYSIRGVN
jgi:hypothetical protein